LAIDKRNPSDLGLWPHQLKAVQCCDAYFTSGSNKGCLVHMPTGTGKTGVMAVLAARRAAEKPVLVVCPSAALVSQLRLEFESEFWEKLGAPDMWRPDSVVQALPGSIDALSEQLKKAVGKCVIVVATIQAVQQIYGAGEVGKLHKIIGTILFDEGHREPAPSWAKVIRGFAVPPVLFSATPFRGDLKVFDIDENQIDFLSFSDAVAKALIRGVKVDERVLGNDPAVVAKQIIDARDKLIAAKVFDKDCKVVVRAASEDTVSDLFNAFVVALGKRDDGVLAMHINFGENGAVGAQRRPDVPNLKTRPEKFLIHQFMLVEGIDDPACTILAVYEPFTSTRMLVQSHHTDQRAYGYHI
jgi:Type III restriction enzyme, res subunit